MTDIKSKQGIFLKVPKVMLQGYPELTIFDRWVAIKLIETCWEDKPYAMSLREIAAITGVSTGLLYTTKGKAPRTGILEKLEKIGILTFYQDAPVNSHTGNKGRIQTYIHIQHQSFWQENALIFPTKSEQQEEDTVNMVYDTVNAVYSDVHEVYDTVPPVYHTVHGMSVNAPDKNGKTREIKQDKKEPVSPMPNGKVQNSKVSSSQSKPLGVTKPHTPKSKRKPLHQFTLLEQACIEAWNACHDFPYSDLQEQEHAQGFADFARLIEQHANKVQTSDIKRIVDYLDDLEYNGKYYYRGRVTPELIAKKAQEVLTALNKQKPIGTTSTSSQPTREELAYSMERGLHWTAMLLLGLPEEQVAYQGEVIPERLIYQYRCNGGDGLGLLVEKYSAEYGIPIDNEMAERIRREDATWAYGGIEAKMYSLT